MSLTESQVWSDSIVIASKPRNTAEREYAARYGDLLRRPSITGDHERKRLDKIATDAGIEPYATRIKGDESGDEEVEQFNADFAG